jgi:hypothetical protein
MIQKKIMPSKNIILLTCFGLILLSGCQNKTTKRAELPDKNSTVVVAYYFHRTVRCATCLAIEANTASAIKENFPQHLAEGILIWMPFNLDDEGGEELGKQFDVTSNTLVLAQFYNGLLIRQKKLEEVWQLVGNAKRFSEYVKNEINVFMNDI